MKLLTFRAGRQLKLGALTDDGVVDLAAEAVEKGVVVPTTPETFYRAGLDAHSDLADLLSRGPDPQHVHDLDKLTLGPAVPTPGKILCVGLNYSKHAAESGMDEPTHPVLFSKFNNALAAPDEDVPISADWSQIDYEAELVVVIGRTCKNVSVDNALDYVLGYCNGNDLSERELQFRSGQWLLGKTLDKFLPIGPYVLTADAAGDPQDMPIKGWYNGELRQNSTTADMIFSVAEVIAYASQYMTLSPGDIISTGTPEGVIIGREDKQYMQAGDTYTVEIGKLGRLTNTLVNA